MLKRPLLQLWRSLRSSGLLARRTNSEPDRIVRIDPGGVGVELDGGHFDGKSVRFGDADVLGVSSIEIFVLFALGGPVISAGVFVVASGSKVGVSHAVQCSP